MKQLDSWECALRGTILCTLFAGALSAQQRPIIVGQFGEPADRPSWIRAVAGQVVSIQVAGIPELTPETPRGRRLLPTGGPTALAIGGIEVFWTKWIARAAPPQPIPLLRVEQISSCGERQERPEECILTIVTGQFPLEVRPPTSPGPPDTPTNEVFVRYREVDSARHVLGFATHNVRLLRDCDILAVGACGSPMVRRLDQPISYLDSSLPVPQRWIFAPGETGRVFAHGLLPPAELHLGEAAPDYPIESPRLVQVGFEWLRANNVWQAEPFRWPKFTGLVPGEVGMQQIQFEIPEPPKDLGPCDNLRVLFNTERLRQSVTVCVQPAE